MLPQEIIRKKRDGGVLSVAEIDFMVAGLTSGVVSEGQVAAFAMAVFFKVWMWRSAWPSPAP